MFNPKVLSILALLVLCAAGFVAFKNQKAYELEIDNRKAAQAALKISQNRLQTAIDAYNATVEEDEMIQEEIVGLLEDEEEQKDVNSGLERVLRERSDELQYFVDNPDMVNEWNDKVRIADSSMDEIKVLDKEIKELSTMVANREEKLDQLTNQDNGLKDDITALKDHISSRSDGRSIDGLKTRIRAVYNTWGFVTLTDGDKNGVVLNSTLDVVRDDEIIAKLLVTTVEQGTASADIVPGSMEPGNALMIGDLVVPASAGMAANAPEPALPAGAATLSPALFR